MNLNKRCDICNVEIFKTNWSKHINTKRHLLGNLLICLWPILIKFGTYTKLRVLIMNIIITFPQSKKFCLKKVLIGMVTHYTIAYNMIMKYNVINS